MPAAATRPHHRSAPTPTPVEEERGHPRFRPAAPDAEAERALALQDMPIEYIICRGQRHQLTDDLGYGVNTYDLALQRDVLQVNWAWRRSTCSRCGYEVEVWYDQVFRRVTSFAKHPADYLLHGMGRAHPSEARRELWRRQLGPQPKAKAKKGAK